MYVFFFTNFDNFVNWLQVQDVSTKSTHQSIGKQKSWSHKLPFDTIPRVTDASSRISKSSKFSKQHVNKYQNAYPNTEYLLRIKSFIALCSAISFLFASS